MKLAHNVRISVFIHEGEDREGIYAKLLSIVPFDVSREKIKVNEDTATGFNEKKIKIYEVVLEKDRHINTFLDFFKEKLGFEQKELLIRQIESRLDNENNFFIRLDKDKLVTDSVFWITDEGNCFHIKISIAAYPKNRENGLKVVEKIFL